MTDESFATRNRGCADLLIGGALILAIVAVLTILSGGC